MTIRSGAIALLPIGLEAEVQSFSPVELAQEDRHHAGGLEIVIGDAIIRVEPGVAPALLVEAIRALRAA